MNEFVKKANQKKIEHIIKNLEKRNMKGYYCDTIKEANEKILSMISTDDLVSWGGSATLDEMGIKENLSNVIDAQKAPQEKAYEEKRRALLSDVYLTSTNN